MEQSIIAPLYKNKMLQKMTGPVLRPGGIELTRQSAAGAGLKPGSRVLDAGCGYGAAAKMLEEEFSVSSFGLDRDYELMASGADIPMIQGEAENLPLKDAVFSLVLCECMLSLSNDPLKVLKEYRRVLEPGGALVLCDIYIREDRVSHFLESIPVSCGFKRASGKEDIRALVVRAGFSSIIWEDLSPVLTRLAGQAVFDHGSLDNFWAVMFGKNCKEPWKIGEKIRESRPGYFRIIAVNHV